MKIKIKFYALQGVLISHYAEPITLLELFNYYLTLAMSSGSRFTNKHRWKYILTIVSSYYLSLSKPNFRKALPTWCIYTCFPNFKQGINVSLRGMNGNGNGNQLGLNACMLAPEPKLRCWDQIRLNHCLDELTVRQLYLCYVAPPWRRGRPSCPQGTQQLPYACSSTSCRIE